MQPFRSSSPVRDPPGRNSPFSLHQLIYNHHLRTSMDRSRTPIERRYHRDLALSVYRTLKLARRASWSWERALKPYVQTPPEPLLPLT